VAVSVFSIFQQKMEDGTSGPKNENSINFPKRRSVRALQIGHIQNNLGNFLLLNPDFFFGVSEPAQKAVLVPFFWSGL
jgi:hypothetical protein